MSEEKNEKNYSVPHTLLPMKLFNSNLLERIPKYIEEI